MSGEPVAVEYGGLTLFDCQPPADDLCADVARGLTGPVRKVPPKYFYDERGAELFERITELDAYYPTRTELAILERSLPEIASMIGPHAKVVEFGSGSGIKTRVLLEHLQEPAAYVPIDISREQLIEFSFSIAESFPALEVMPVCADYTRRCVLPQPRGTVGRTVAFFPGSTIGNFEREDALHFLERVGSLCGSGGGLLIGVDLRKDEAVLERAYNDPEGVTAEFNLNLLQRINRECGADFDLGAFHHLAIFDPEEGRIEMRLVSDRDQEVRLARGAGGDSMSLHFQAADHIVTEYSHKYTIEGFREMARSTGWARERIWTDERKWFSVWLLERE